MREVFVIDEKGESIGVIPTDDAIARAMAVGLDLVEVNPNARPPVTKIMDYGKYKYRLKKRKAQSAKASSHSKVKDIRFHPTTDKHDVEVRLRQAIKFLEHGDKVLVSCVFRGREMAHRELGERLLISFRDQLQLYAKPEREPSFEGKKLIMMLAPLPLDIRKKLMKEAEEAKAKADHSSGRVRRVITLEEAAKSKDSGRVAQLPVEKS